MTTPYEGTPNLANPAHYNNANSHETMKEVDHDKILRDYDSAIRDHERRMHRHRRHIRHHRDRTRSPRPSKRFRFKADSNKASSNQERHSSSKDAGVEAYAAHPLPRPKPSEYLDPDFSASVSPPPTERMPQPAESRTSEGPDAAFRSSLFDAMADDEGAAYWESVYGEPIHVYSRPTVQTENGLEQMSDEQYVEYVKRKMWEKKNPELVAEREARAKRELEEDKKRQRRRNGFKDDEESAESDYEWVGDEEKGYERRRIRGKARPRESRTSRPGTGNRGFMSDVDEALARGARRKEAKKWQQAWAQYHKNWEALKNNTDTLQGAALARAIPWPVASGFSQNVNKENVEDFIRNYSLAEGETRMGLLKAERFRWHPDKIQHRFGRDNVDDETLKLVTSVFQVIDEMMSQEKNKEG